MKLGAFGSGLLVGDAWRDRDYTGERVGVIASGRDAARVVPAVARTAHAIKLFCREPAWVLPELSPSTAAALRVLERATGNAGRIEAMVGRLHLRRRVADSWARRLLTPDRRFQRPDVVASDAFYEVLQQPHCKLVHWPVYAVVDGGVRTAEGIEHRVDLLVVPDPTTLPGERNQPCPSAQPRV